MLGRLARVTLLGIVLSLSGCAALVQHPAPRLESDIRQLRLLASWQDIAAYGEFDAEAAMTSHFEIVWDADGQLEHFYLPFVVPDRKGGWTAAIADYLPAAQGGSSLRAYPLPDPPDPATYVPVVAVLAEIDRQGLGKLADDLRGRRAWAAFQTVGARLRFAADDAHRVYVLRDGERQKVEQGEMDEAAGRLAVLTLTPLSPGAEGVSGVVYLLPALP